jgi:tetratricopeptide (TPR) repeat protein
MEHFIYLKNKRMKIKILFILLFIMSVNFSYSQETIYEVDYEVRMISEEKIQVANNHLYTSKNYAQAARICEEIIEKDPTFREAYIILYSSLRGIKDQHALLLKRLKEAKEIFEEDDELSYYEGNILQDNSKIKEAIISYSDAIAFSKVNGEDYPIVWAYYFNRGNCQLKLQQYELGIKDYDYSLKLSPENADILTNRGYCYFKINQKSKACADWNKSFALGNDFTKKYLDLYCK